MSPLRFCCLLWTKIIESQTMFLVRFSLLLKQNFSMRDWILTFRDNFDACNHVLDHFLLTFSFSVLRHSAVQNHSLLLNHFWSEFVSWILFMCWKYWQIPIRENENWKRMMTKKKLLGNWRGLVRCVNKIFNKKWSIRKIVDEWENKFMKRLMIYETLILCGFFELTNSHFNKKKRRWKMFIEFR